MKLNIQLKNRRYSADKFNDVLRVAQVHAPGTVIITTAWSVKFMLGDDCIMQVKPAQDSDQEEFRAAVRALFTPQKEEK